MFFHMNAFFVTSAFRAFSLAILFAGSATLAMGQGSAHKGEHHGQAMAQEESASKDKSTSMTYPLDVCIVSGEKLGEMGDPVIYNYQDREIRFCCKGCVKEFEKEPEKYLKKMDEAIIKKQLPKYPLDACLISGGKLGEMGDPVNIVHNNQLVRFCCKGCIGKFKKDPDKYMAQLIQAWKKQKENERKQGDEQEHHSEDDADSSDKHHDHSH